MSDKSKEIEKAIKQEKGKLFNYIRKNVKLKEDAEDILQDVFYQFVTGFGEIEFVEKISIWLMRVAKNKIIDWRRHKTAGNIENDRLINLQDSSDDPIMLSEIMPDFSTIPDKLFWQDFIWDEIDEALEEMPKEQSEVFILNEFEEMSFKEISERLNVSVNTLLSRKRYAVL
ncbi:MAG: RNA polymerase sigma factor, partial [Methanococcaceae archaeon]